MLKISSSSTFFVVERTNEPFAQNNKWLVNKISLKFNDLHCPGNHQAKLWRFRTDWVELVLDPVLVENSKTWIFQLIIQAFSLSD